MEAWNKHLTDGEREIVNKKIDAEVNAVEGTYAQKETKRKFMQNLVNDMSVYALYKTGWIEDKKATDFDYDIELNIPITLRIGTEPEKKFILDSGVITDETLQKIFEDIDEHIVKNIMRNR